MIVADQTIHLNINKCGIQTNNLLGMRCKLCNIIQSGTAFKVNKY